MTETGLTDSLKLNLSEIIDDIFMVLTEKEKEVVVKRFSLDNRERRTLESIGRSFNVTRERVRQIEKIALGKLRRTVTSTKLKLIHELSLQLIQANGGILLEDTLVEMVLERMEKHIEVDNHIIRLSLTICPGIQSIEKNKMIKMAWHLESINPALVRDVLNQANKCLKSNKEEMTEAELVRVLSPSLKDFPSAMAFIASCLAIDERMKKVDDAYGLMTWRHINPKSIRDKAFIVLKREGEAMHFVDIAHRIMEYGFDSKTVTTQAVHNELIRYPQFVLVGRGLYALKEWGYQDGTVTDIIEALLAKKSPLTKQDIIKGVLKQRQVKKGTISLNLQKNPQFVRVGRAVYDLDLSKKVS